jgi:hypothetical protein
MPISCDRGHLRGSILQMGRPKFVRVRDVRDVRVRDAGAVRRVRIAVAIATAVLPAVAQADDRIDLPGIPDAQILEPAFHLDRGTDYSEREKHGVDGWIGLGGGRYHGIDLAIANAAFAFGWRDDNFLVAGRGELAVGESIEDSRLLRGRYRALAEARTDWDAELGAVVALTTSFEHGDGLGLSTTRLGAASTPRDNGDLVMTSLVRIGKRSGDFSWVASARAEVGGTRWYDTPQLDYANRKALGMGLGKAPLDGELPRGSIEVIRARVEHTEIHRPRIGGIDVAGAPAGMLDGEVREAQVGMGTTDMTLYIDHELLAVIAVDLGWSWLEADTANGTIADNAFRMRLGTDLEWRDETDKARRRVGFALVRTPTATADGQRLAGEWRIEGISVLETRRFVLDGRGGISWLHLFEAAPDAAPAPMLVRYGAQLEALVKLGGGIEAGAYHANAYEPRQAGDPWASARIWVTETGFLARWRP